MTAQPQPISKYPPTAVAANGYLTPLTEVPTPGPSPSSTPAPPSRNLPPTPPPTTDNMASFSPYETDPARIPADDAFADIPNYGRYAPSPDDFVPAPQHIMSTTPESIAYWEGVLRERCTADTLMLSPVDDDPSVALGRWIFAVGSVVVKTNHLAPAGRRRRDYSGVDRNEVEAVRLVRERCETDVKVPEVYFAGKLLNGDVLIQQRLPGVSLEVAWPYLSPLQKSSLKRQCRAFLVALLRVGTSPTGKRSYVVDDYNAIWARALTPRERKLMLPPPPGRTKGVGWPPAAAKRKDSANSSSLPPSPLSNSGGGGGSVFFTEDVVVDDEEELAADPDTRFTHNDLSTGNVIVGPGDRVIGVCDWEHAGWLGWRVARHVHERIRAPLPDMYEKSEFGSEEEWADFVWGWKDLYELTGNNSVGWVEREGA